MELQLSISMLVTDGRPTLEKCLRSIQPILREIPSELIVVFTGKEPATLDTIRKYTDHIVPFEWCNDFSKARNAGLREAKGEWFLYLDDDEWFEDTSEILRFFQSGEYRNYDAAFYIQRNYTDAEGISFVDTDVLRMHRHYPQLRFVSSIHEYLDAPHTAIKKFGDFVHHYGYAAKKGQPLRFSRNISLLEKEIESRGEKFSSRQGLELSRLYMQLAQEYQAAGLYQKAEKCCRLGMDTAKKSGRHNTMYYWMLIHCPKLILLQEESGRAEKAALEMLADPWCKELAAAYLHCFLANLYLARKNAEEGFRHIEEFWKNLEILQKDPSAALWQTAAEYNLSALKNEIPAICEYGVSLSMLEQDAEALAENLDKVPWDAEPTAGRCCMRLEKRRKEFPEMNAAFLRYFYEKESENPYVLLMQCLYFESMNDSVKLQKAYSKCSLQIIGDYRSLNALLLAVALRNGLDITMFTENLLSDDYWSFYAEEIVSEIPVNDWKAQGSQILQTLGAYPKYRYIFEEKLLEQKLLQVGLTNEELAKTAKYYCETVLSYYKTLYRKELFQGEGMELPAKCGFCLCLSEALDAIEKRQWENCYPSLRRALHRRPEKVRLIEELFKYAQDCRNTPPENPEMTALAGQIRQQVELLADHGDYQNAYAILGQVLALMPEDWELLKLKQRILREC